MQDICPALDSQIVKAQIDHRGFGEEERCLEPAKLKYKNNHT